MIYSTRPPKRINTTLCLAGAVIQPFKLLTTGQVFRLSTQRDQQSFAKEFLHLFTSSW
jgi:hypothetical protein